MSSAIIITVDKFIILQNVSSQVTGSETKSLEKDIEEINDIIIEEAEEIINKQGEEKKEEKVPENEIDTVEIDATIVLESIDDHDSNNNSNANTSADEVIKSEAPEIKIMCDCMK